MTDRSSCPISARSHPRPDPVVRPLWRPFIVKYLHYMATPETDALDRLLRVVVVLGDDMTRSLARDGLTDSRAHLLWVLRQSGPTTQRALADAMNVSPRNVTGLLDGLVSGGF